MKSLLSYNGNQIQDMSKSQLRQKIMKFLMENHFYVSLDSEGDIYICKPYESVLMHNVGHLFLSGEYNAIFTRIAIHPGNDKDNKVVYIKVL